MKKEPNVLLTVLYIIWQWTWGFLHSFVGFVLRLMYIGHPHEWRRGACLTMYDKARSPIKDLGCISLGMFIFIGMPEGGGHHEEQIERGVAHEYGHTIQSLIYGPLYLFVVGIPSLVWSARYYGNKRFYNEKNIYYTSRFPESEAEAFGRKFF